MTAVIVPNFMAICRTVAEILRFFFQIMAVRHLVFAVRVFGPLTNIFGGVCHCAKFG